MTESSASSTSHGGQPAPVSPGHPTSRGTVGGSVSGPQPTLDLGAATIPVASGWHLPLSAFLGALMAVVSSTAAVVHFLRVEPLQRELETLQQAQVSLDSERQSLSNQLRTLGVQYRDLVKTADRPVLLSPRDATSVIGLSTTFRWDDPDHRPAAGYMLHLRRLDTAGSKEEVLNVTRPEALRAYHDLDGVGEYLWRIRRGRLIGTKEVPEGELSRANVFTVYPTVTSRVRTTRRLLVATTPTSYDAFVSSDGAGSYGGFEMEFVSLLARHLEKSIGITGLEVEPVELPWRDLFQSIQDGLVDIAVRSISRSAARERAFPNLRFSDGYLTNHQVFVALPGTGPYPASLNGSVVGVKADSLNGSAARFLAPKLGFTVDAQYTAYSDLYEALAAGRIGFALVDSTLVRRFLTHQFVQIGPELDHELREFYMRELGAEREEYAVLVHESSKDDKVRTAINAILRSSEFVTALNQLKVRFGIN